MILGGKSRKVWVAPRNGGYSAPAAGPAHPVPPSGPGAVTIEAAVDALIDPLVKVSPADVMAARAKRLRVEANERAKRRLVDQAEDAKSVAEVRPVMWSSES